MIIDLCSFDIELLREIKGILEKEWNNRLHVQSADIEKHDNGSFTVTITAHKVDRNDNLILAIAQVSAAIDIVEHRETVTNN